VWEAPGYYVSKAVDLVEELSVKGIDGVPDSTLGTNLGRHLVCLAETVTLSTKRSQCVCVWEGVMDYHCWRPSLTV
jgi:hypothetical protein